MIRALILLVALFSISTVSACEPEDSHHVPRIEIDAALTCAEGALGKDMLGPMPEVQTVPHGALECDGRKAVAGCARITSRRIDLDAFFSFATLAHEFGHFILHDHGEPLFTHHNPSDPTQIAGMEGKCQWPRF